MLEVVVMVVEGLILFHRSIQVTEVLIPPRFNALCNRGDSERGVTTLRFENLGGRRH
jgi:hypothetical protein